MTAINENWKVFKETEVSVHSFIEREKNLDGYHSS